MSLTPVRSTQWPENSAWQWPSRLVWLALAFCGLIRGGNAESATLLSGYRLSRWTAEQGLPRNTVQCLLQDRQGYLWIGTRAGLVRHDGLRFTAFDQLAAPAVRHLSFIALAEDAEGALWMATNEGLWRWHHQRLTHFTPREGLCDNRVWTLVPRRNGELWIGTEKGVNCYRDSRMRAAYPRRATLACEDAEGTLWIWSEHQLYRWNEVTAQFERFILAAWNGTLAADPRGGIWWGGQDGLHRFKDGQLTHYSAPQGAPDSFVERVYPDRSGTLWVDFRYAGLHQFRDGKFRSLGWPDQLPEQPVLVMGEDREGNVWLGTDFSGLVRLQPKRLRTYTTADGLVDDAVQSLCLGHDQTLWISTARGTSRFDQDRLESFPAPRTGPFKFEAASCLLFDTAGRLWGGVRDGLDSISLFDGKRFARDHRVAGSYMDVLFEDRAGLIWAGTSEGLLCRRDGHWERFADATGHSPKGIRAILQDRAGQRWFGSGHDGLLALREGRFVALTQREGLADNQVDVLHEDPTGRLWIGTRNGLSRLSAGRLDTLTTRHGLFDNAIQSLVEDDTGQFWLGCPRGIFRVSRRELEAVVDHQSSQVRCVAYGEADGMASSETARGHQATAVKTRDGRLWFGTTKGLVVITPETLRDNEVPPPVVIEQVRANDRIIFGDGTSAQASGNEPRSKRRASAWGGPPETGAASVSLPPGSGRLLEIRYTANTFMAPEKARFRYHLEGWDRDWQTDEQNRRVAFYTNLRPGRYAFRVKACNNHGVWNEAPEVFAFVLQAHFYETMPFFAACAASLLLAGLGLHRLRVRVLRRIQVLEQQHAMDRERARIAADLHDDLGSRLAQLSLLGELATRGLEVPSPAQPLVERLRRATGEVFQALDEVVWAVNPKHDSVAGLVSHLREFAPEFLASAGLHCRLDFPPPQPDSPLRAKVRHHLFLVVKEALHNVLKHARATEVWLRLRLEGSLLLLTIEDDGRGFTPPEPQSPQAGNGLASMRERSRQLGGQFHLETQPGQGTKITVRVPL